MRTRGASLSIKLAMAAAVLAVFALAYLDLRREQARALADFTAEQATLARSFAAALSARIDGVVRLLDAPVDVASRDQVDRWLSLTAGDGREIVEAVVLASDRHRLAGRTAPGVASLYDAEPLPDLDALAARAGDGVAVSAPLRRPGSPARLRWFARRRGDGLLLLLADTDRFFDGMPKGDSDGEAPMMRWLVVDDAGRFVELRPSPGDPEWRTGDPADGEVAQLVQVMRAGSGGAVFLGREAAASLDLGRRSAVAGYAPVIIRERLRWSVAVVTSARRVRDRARLAAWRLAAATGLAALLVALFGVLMAAQQRREHQLGEALRVAEATAALRERSEKIVEAIPLGVLALDGTARVTSANPYLAERGVVAGGSLAAALSTPAPEELAPLEALLAEARATRTPAHRASLSLRLGGPEPRDVDAYAIPLGRPLADIDCFLVLHDRTEMRLLERNLIRAEKLATIGTLAAGVAHEVGTPLGIISGRAEQLLSKVPPGDGGEPMRKGVSSILAQVDKVSSTIRQLLDFARARPIETDAVTPAQALANAAALLEHRFRQAKVELTVDAPPSVPAIAADPGQLEQVLVNLMLNACDACQAGGHVAVRARGAHDRVSLEVGDDGAGIPAEHLSSVLDPFFTTKKRGQGTGLGLTIAADIVKNHGGTLEIDSIVGRGTTVRVTLPLATSVSA